jgi:hypothetical protein
MKKYMLHLTKITSSSDFVSDDFVDRVEIWHWDNHSQFDSDIRNPENRKYIEDNDVILMIGDSINRVNHWVGKIIACQT